MNAIRSLAWVKTDLKNTNNGGPIHFIYGKTLLSGIFCDMKEAALSILKQD